jgi:ABC-type arginine transport system ATPase subunit
MKIDSIRIRNFRCFPEADGRKWGVVFRPNAELSLIVGPNGAGKTAILDALDLVLNAENRSNQVLITEYDFTNCDTSKPIYIDVTLSDLGQAHGDFASDIQWVDPADGQLVEEKGIEPDVNRHLEVVIIALEAVMDPRSGAIEWRWLLPKFPATSIESAKELSRSQHQSLGYFRIRPTISAGAFTLGQYSPLGRHLRKLQYRLGKLPSGLSGQTSLPTCSLYEPQCSTCPHYSDCIPDMEDEAPPSSNAPLPTIGTVLKEIVAGAGKVLVSSKWTEMEHSLGPRYGGLSSALAALTIGVRPVADESRRFIPFERLSSGEKYALSFSLAKTQIPGERPPVIVMEEPETALYPSAISTLLRTIQAIPTGKAPQVIISSHSESVLRCFLPSDIFVLEKGQGPTKLDDVINTVRPAVGPFSSPEYFIMPGGPSALFADRVLVVEGVQDVIMSGHLDRLAARHAADGSVVPHISFSLQGWCVFAADRADQVLDCVRVYNALGKKTVSLFDGDNTGRRYAEQSKDICPTFVYRTSLYPDPALEEALLAGLPPDDREQVLKEVGNCPSCQFSAPKRCWVQKVKCAKGNRKERKILLQRLCLEAYERLALFPPAFGDLLNQIDSATTGKVHQLNADY